MFWIEAAAAAIAGAVIGQFVANGQLGLLLAKNGLVVGVTPGHPDGAAGLQPIGKLYLRQATLVAAIGLYAGVWWLIFPEIQRYTSWRDPYLALVVTCLVLEWLAFFVPMHSFHRLMVRERERLLPTADLAASRVVEIEGELGRSADTTQSARLEAEKAAAIKRFTDIEEMPSWPLTPRIRRRFGWNNVVIVIPLFLQWVGAPKFATQLNEVIGRIQ